MAQTVITDNLTILRTSLYVRARHLPDGRLLVLVLISHDSRKIPSISERQLSTYNFSSHLLWVFIGYTNITLLLYQITNREIDPLIS